MSTFEDRLQKAIDETLLALFGAQGREALYMRFKQDFHLEPTELGLHFGELRAALDAMLGRTVSGVVRRAVVKRATERRDT